MPDPTQNSSPNTTLTLGALKRALAGVSETDPRPVVIRLFLTSDCDPEDIRDMAFEPDDLDALIPVSGMNQQTCYILSCLESPYTESTRKFLG